VCRFSDDKGDLLVILAKEGMAAAAVAVVVRVGHRCRFSDEKGALHQCSLKRAVGYAATSFKILLDYSIYKHHCFN